MNRIQEDSEFHKRTEQTLRVLGHAFSPKMMADLLSDEREGVTPGSEKDVANSELIHSESVMAIITDICDKLAPSLEETAIRIVAAATKIVEKITSPAVLEKGLKFTGAVADFIKKYGNAVFPIARVIIKLVTMLVRIVIWVVDQILRLSTPVLSRLIGYSLKVLIPIIAVELGIGTASIAPLLAAVAPFVPFFSDERVKERIETISANDRERFLDQLFTNPVKMYKYMDEYGDGGVHIGGMAQGYDFPVVREQDGIKIISAQDMLALLVLGVQELNARTVQQANWNEDAVDIFDQTKTWEKNTATWASRVDREIVVLERLSKNQREAILSIERGAREAFNVTTERFDSLDERVSDLDIRLHALETKELYGGMQ